MLSVIEPEAFLFDLDAPGQRETWRSFAPDLHVDDAAFMAGIGESLLTQDAIEAAAALIQTEGYFQLTPTAWDLPLRRMAGVIQNLASLGAPPVLAFHFDEFWMMFAALRPLLCRLLGDDPLTLPDFWAWHIDPARQESGWAPHRDRGRRALLADGRPKLATLWLPLTDATPDNGCMYIVPADRDPTYGTDQECLHQFDLTDIRALPAAAGSVLGWDQAVLHWGSHAANRDVPARISMACEFQRRDVEPFGAPLFDPAEPPDFAMRQVLIGRQLLRYDHMTWTDQRWQDWAARAVASDR